MAVVTGHGATLGFTTISAWSPDYTSIGSWSIERPKLDTSHLGTTGVRTSRPGDLYDVSSFTANFFFEPEEADNDIDGLLFTAGVANDTDTCTITYPTANNWTAEQEAFVMGFEHGELVTDTLMSATLTVQWSDWPAIASP